MSSLPSMTSDFLDEIRDIALPDMLLKTTLDVADSLLRVDLLSDALLSATPTLVLFQWPIAGINFCITSRAPLLVYRITKFDRTKPARDLVAPLVIEFDSRELAEDELVKALHEANSDQLLSVEV
jgi:hypothetical protein